MKLDGAIGHIPYMLKIAIEIPTPVSYTHLDVYKRQEFLRQLA